MDLSTRYMGLTLKHPVVASAGPLTADIDSIRRLADAGAAAVVLHSLFEEQIRHEQEELAFHTRSPEAYAEMLSFFPEPDDYWHAPDAYLKLIQDAKAAVDMPVIASLNGVTPGGWTAYARKMQDAGADGLELNVYHVATDPEESSEQVEQRYLDILRAVKSSVTIPVAMKLGPYFSSMASMARKLDDAGADALVLFNRFYQPTIDLDALDVTPDLVLSAAFEMRLPLRWIAILHGRLRAGLAATSGVATGEDVIRMTMAGADVVQVCSVLLRKGPGELSNIVQQVRRWMDEHTYASIAQMKGSLSQRSCPDPSAFERANYMKTLQSYT